MGGSRAGRAFSYQAPELFNQLPVWIQEEEHLKVEARAPWTFLLPSIPSNMEKLLHITDANSDVLCLRGISLSIPGTGSLICGSLKGCFFKVFLDPVLRTEDTTVQLVKPSVATKAV